MTADHRSCESFEAELSAWLDGELPVDRAAQVQRHLADCAACAARAGRLRQVDVQLRALPHAAPPPALRERLQRRIEAAAPVRTNERANGAPPRRARRLPWRAGLAFAAGLAALALVLLSPDRVGEVREAPSVVALQPRADRAGAPPETAVRSAPAADAAASQPERRRGPVPSDPARSERPTPPAPAVEEVSLEELELALELEQEDLDVESVEDLEVIANLELLEALLALQEGTG